MKLLNFSSVIAIAIVIGAGFSSCQKDVSIPEITRSAKAVGGLNAASFDITLIGHDYNNGQTTFVWTIQNNNASGGKKNTATQDLSHWSMSSAICLTNNWSDVLSSLSKVGNGPIESGTTFIGLDGSQTCLSGANFYKFDRGTSGNLISTFTLVLDGQWTKEQQTAVLKAGSACSTKTFEGVGCRVDENNCSLSQGYWFSKPNISWVNGLTLGGQIYSKQEGEAIFSASNAGGIKDAKKAFTQVAAVILSGVDTDAAIAADVLLIKNYFDTYYSSDKLSPANLSNSPANASIEAAAGRISNWINSNHCD